MMNDIISYLRIFVNIILLLLSISGSSFSQNIILDCSAQEVNKNQNIDLSAYCPPVVNQGILSSCTGYGNGYYAMSIMYNKALNITDSILKSNFAFSANFPYDVIKKEGAANPIDVLNNLKEIGNLRYIEYDILDMSQKVGNETINKFYKNASKFKIKHFQCIVDPEINKKGTGQRTKSIDYIKCALINGYPVTVNISQTSSFNNLKKKTYVPSSNDFLVGEHMITILGYDDISNRFKLVNSYGKEWGDSGFGYISFSDLLDMMNYAYVFQIDNSLEALSHYQTRPSSEILQGDCFGNNKINFNTSVFNTNKLFDGAISLNNTKVVAAKPYIDGNIITIQSEIINKDKNEIIHLKKLSPQGNVLIATKLSSPLFSNDMFLHSACIESSPDGSIFIVLTLFDGANYFNYFTHYDFKLKVIKNITTLLNSQGKEFTPTSNILYNKNRFLFVIHDNYFYLYKYNIQTKELIKSIINYEDLDDPIFNQRRKSLEREVQNLHLQETQDDEFLVFGTYEINYKKEHNGFFMFIDAKFTKFIKFDEIKELKTNKLTYIKSVNAINKKEFLISGNIGCEPYLYLAEITSSKEIKITKKYDLLKHLGDYHLAALTNTLLVGDHALITISIIDNETMNSSIFPLIIKIPLDQKKPSSSEELYQKEYTYSDKIVVTQENKLVFILEKTKLKHPYMNTFSNYCDELNYSISQNFDFGDQSIWLQKDLNNKNSVKNHEAQSWTIDYSTINPIELDSVVLVPIVLTPTETAMALCNPYIDIICNDKASIDILERIYLDPLNKKTFETIYVPVKNKNLSDNEKVEIQCILGESNKNITKKSIKLLGKTRKINLNVTGKLIDPTSGNNIVPTKNNIPVLINLDIHNLSNVNLQKVEIEFPDLGTGFTPLPKQESYPLKSGRNQINNAFVSKKTESISLSLFIDDVNSIKPLKINIYLNDQFFKTENLGF